MARAVVLIKARAVVMVQGATVRAIGGEAASGEIRSMGTRSLEEVAQGLAAGECKETVGHNRGVTAWVLLGRYSNRGEAVSLGGGYRQRATRA